MKKSISAVSIGVLIVLATGCTAQSTTKAEPTPAPAYQAPTATQPSSSYREDMYVKVIRDEYPQLVSSMGEAWIIEFGRSMCEFIDNGMTMADLADAVASFDVDGNQVGYMLGAGISAFCPENQWFLEN